MVLADLISTRGDESLLAPDKHLIKAVGQRPPPVVTPAAGGALQPKKLSITTTNENGSASYDMDPSSIGSWGELEKLLPDGYVK